MGFAEEHQRWLEYHKKRRTGERLDRLDRGAPAWGANVCGAGMVADFREVG
ncbi:hypothetical protein ACFSQ7_40020 [Paenibacillus rhizoplanae]